MQFNIINEKENALFNRKEIEAKIDAEITPSHEEVKKLISEKFSVPIENIKIKNIIGKFGSKTFDVFANIYASKEDKDKIELKKKREIEAEKKIEEEKKVTEEAVKSEESETPVEEIVKVDASESEVTPEKIIEKSEEKK